MLQYFSTRNDWVQVLMWSEKGDCPRGCTEASSDSQMKTTTSSTKHMHQPTTYIKIYYQSISQSNLYSATCLHSQAALYLVEFCQPVAGVASQQHLWSATRQLLVVLRHQLSSYGGRAFCVAGLSVWNSLPDSLQDPVIGGNSFRQSPKTFLFATYWCIQRIRGFTTMRYINRLFTYLQEL